MKTAIFGKTENDWGLEGVVGRGLLKAAKSMKIFDVARFNSGQFLSEEKGYDALVFIQGRNIRRDFLQSFNGKKILWNTEFWPYKGMDDNQEALFRLYMVEPLEGFDLVLNGCPLSTDFLREVRGINIEWFPMFGVDKDYHNKVNIKKSVDVGFFGVPSPRRIEIWSNLINEVGKNTDRPIKVVWKRAYGKELVEFINSCKIVLNIHFCELLNTESRIYETLACGTYCLSENISYPELFVDGVHLGISSTETIPKLAARILQREQILEKVAKEGYNYVHNRFNILSVLNLLEEKIEKLF